MPSLSSRSSQPSLPSQLSEPPRPSRPPLPSWFRHAWQHWHRPLMVFTAAMAALAVVSGAGLLLDDRVVVDAPVWLKPLKFAISFGLYTFSAAWLLSRLPASAARAGRRAGTWLTVFCVIEIIPITVQAARGRRSHFNGDTALDTAVFYTMAGAAGAIWLASIVIAVLVLRQRERDRAMRLAIGVGLILALVGMAIAFRMGMNSQHDPATNSLGAHTVGAPDGGSGVPVTGWSTTGGDLRVPHFFGMHALQLLPLVVWALDAAALRRPRLRDARVRYRLTRTACGASAGGLFLVTWQALRGQPLLAPDALTWTALLVLLAATAVGTLHALRPGPRPQHTPGPDTGPQSPPDPSAPTASAPTASAPASSVPAVSAPPVSAPPVSAPSSAASPAVSRKART